MEKNLTLFVGGLVSRVTEKDLKDIFENYGVISNIKIIKNQKNNYSKGYGFIDAESEEHMNQIIKNDFFFCGRKLDISTVNHGELKENEFKRQMLHKIY